MNVVCMVIDRLQAGYLGTYGNAWIKTPALDRLASRSLVFDFATVDSPDLQRLYRSYWQGCHAMCPPASADRPTLAGLLRGAGLSTVLMTDESCVSGFPGAGDFDELVQLDPPWQPQAAAEIDQTHFARCAVEMLRWLGSVQQPFLLWCHWGGLGTTWDAPYEFRQAYADQGDPDPPRSADPPELMLPADHDPDYRLGIVQSYAGQVTLLDTCLGAIVEYLDGSPLAADTALVLVSARGFPLGEHGRVGKCDDALYGEVVHVPWLMRMPNMMDSAARSHALVEPADLWATLLDLWSVQLPYSPTGRSLMPIVNQQTESLRDRVCVLGQATRRAIRTPAWYLYDGDRPELYAKPDDRWEQNDVASRCPEVVEGLQAALEQYELTLPDGRISDLPPLDKVLLSGL